MGLNKAIFSWKSFKSGEQVTTEEFSDVDYQDIGAPVEEISPLGYNVNWATVFFMVLGGILGTGIFSTPGAILKSVGSVGLSYVFWIIGFLFVSSQMCVYLEFMTYYKRRSGGEVAYLEQAFPKPQFFMPAVFAAVTVLLSFVSSSAIASSQYILNAAEVEPTTWRQRGLAVGVLLFVIVFTGISSKWTIKLSNLLGSVKVIFFFFIAITGLVVLGGHTRVQNPTAIFHNSMQGTSHDANSLSNALVKVNFAFGGSGYVFNVVGESKNPVKIYRIFAPAALLLTLILYLLTITAFYASSTVDEIKNSGVLVATLFFKNVFGTKASLKALDSFVAISAIGHLISVIIAQSRALRECGRQGVLPFNRFWVSTKPFGTPLGPLLIIFIVNFIIIVAPPAGDAYNFVVDLATYPNVLFQFVLTIGLLRVRGFRKKKGLGYVGFKTPWVVIIFNILVDIFMLVMPWVPPSNGSLKGSDVSFFYATYCIVSIGILILCGLYFYAWRYWVPKWKHYQLRQTVVTLENGEAGIVIIKVPNSEVEAWDSTHDQHGNNLSPAGSSVEDSSSIKGIRQSITKIE